MRTFLFLLALVANVVLEAQTAYVTNRGDNNVSVIDVSTEMVTNTIPVGLAPMRVAFTPDGSTAFVTNASNDNSVSVIDVSMEMVTNTITVGSTPIGVAITPDGSTAYITNFVDDNVSVIDVSTEMVTNTITVGDGPRGVAITPDGSTAYVVNGLDANVSVIDVSSEMVTNTIGGTGTQEVAFTPDGSTAYVTGSNVSVIDVSTEMVTNTITVGSNPVGVAFTPDGSKAYVTNFSSDTVSVIDVSTEMVTNTITVGDGPTGVAFTPIPIPPIPPIDGSVNGICKTNVFLAQTEIFNVLSWDAVPGATGYRVYRDEARTILAGETISTQFDDHNRKPNVTYTYFIVVVNASGGETLIGSTVVNCPKLQ